jgi:hypothetical protein
MKAPLSLSVFGASADASLRPALSGAGLSERGGG